MSVSQGSYTVGQAGADYLTWDAALDDVASPLTGNLTFTQIADTSETSATSRISWNLGGFTLKLTVSVSHGGIIGSGVKINYSASQATGVFNFSNPSNGTLIIENMNIVRTLTSMSRMIYVAAASSCTVRVNNIIVDLSYTTTLAAYATLTFNTAVGTANVQVSNVMVVEPTFNTSASYPAILADSSGGGSLVVENCSIVGGKSGGVNSIAFNPNNSATIFRNCVALELPAASRAFANLSGAIGYGCMSYDATAGTFPGGGGNISNVVALDEYESITTTDATYMVPKSSQARNSGYTPTNTDNTEGINAKPRPHYSGAVSIGPKEAFAATPVITVQPLTQTVPEGDTATFDVTATGAVGYQWQKKPYGGSWGDVSGAESASYETPLTSGGDHLTLFRCRIIGESSEALSGEAYLLLNGWPVPWSGSESPDPPTVTVVSRVDRTFILNVAGVADLFRAEIRNMDNEVVAYAERATPGELTVIAPDQGVSYSLLVAAANVNSPPAWSAPGLILSFIVPVPAQTIGDIPGVGISPTPSTPVSEAGPLGAGLAFPFRFSSSTGAPEVNYGVDHVIDGMIQILRTRQGDRPIRRNFGSPLGGRLFEPDTVIGSNVSANIQMSIAQFEPRAEVTSVRFTRNRVQGELNAQIFFRTFRSHQSGNFVYPFNLEV